MASPNSILILEDDPDRMARFIFAINAIDPTLKVTIWRSARKLIREIEPLLADALLISLDHDLLAATNNPDPGTGLDAAKHLATLNFTCPIIIHSSNAYGASKMGDELASHKVKTINPLGTDWIESHWQSEASKLLRDA